MIPFLPLEVSHVKKCIKDEIYKKARHYRLTPNVENEIASMLMYRPKGNPVFARFGCRRVSEKVDLFLERHGEL